MLKQIVLVATALSFATAAHAQQGGAADYPNKPIKVIVTVPAGGGVDTVTRILTERLRQKWGQPVVIDNRGGAAGNIGAEAVFTSDPDGYTLMASQPAPLTVNAVLYQKLSFDPTALEPVVVMSHIPNVLLVRKDFPAKTAAEFVAYAKANPGKLNFASQGPGTTSHLTAELFASLTGTTLDATLVQQNYSRLVIDCNRTPGTETSIPDISELTPIPGNIGLSEARKAARVREIFQPYHDRIETELDRRRQAGRPAALIAMHSFTPVFLGVARPWHAGVLYNRDPRFAHLLMALLKREAGLIVGDNEPYSVTDASDYTIPVHGERRGLHHVAIEIRQDLIADDKGQQAWGGLLARLLPQAYRELLGAEALRPA